VFERVVCDKGVYERAACEREEARRRRGRRSGRERTTEIQEPHTKM
jgi:hypothetical protein